MSERLNTQDLIDLFMSRQKLDRKEAEDFVKVFFSLIEEGLERDKLVKIKGFGTFKLIDVEPRESINVNTGERIEIQGHTKISFTPDPALRDTINKPFAHFETVILNDDIEIDNARQEQSSEQKDINVTQNKSTSEMKESEEESLEPIEEPGVEAVAEEEVQPAITQEKQETKPERGNSILIIIIVLITLLCGALLTFIYNPDIFSKKGEKQEVTRETLQENIIQTVPVADADTVRNITEASSIAAGKSEIERNASSAAAKSQSRRVTPFSQIPVYPDSTSYEIVGTRSTHVVREGESLIRISYRYYKTKDLWPYLLMYNRSLIKDPNNVPFGVSIQIPELKKK